MAPQVIAAIVAASVALLSSLSVAVYTQHQAHKQKREENFLLALEWLTGKSQRRNVGISAVEFYWDNKGKFQRFKDMNRRIRSLSIDALSNSAMYLLLQSGQGVAVHEINNLNRIMRLLLKITGKEAKEHDEQLEELREALQRACERRRGEGRIEQRGENGKIVTVWVAPDKEWNERKSIWVDKEWREGEGIWVAPPILDGWKKELERLFQ